MDPVKNAAYRAEHLKDFDASFLQDAGSGARANSALKAAQGDRKFPSPTPNFQFHHQPFNYFANMDPVKNAAYRAEHLKDFDASFLQE
ncbi:hypothetical protein [Herbaspirillum lusitanum]|uniref:hypothetical protein n=1 Tax=Herbaspirillum lusitanum TaxID=213312 RepID=UPI0003001FEB